MKRLILIGLLALGLNGCFASHTTRMTAEQAVTYVCAHTEDATVLEQCQVAVPPTVRTDWSLGAELVEGELTGILGEYSQGVPDTVWIDPLLLKQENWYYNAVLIHEVVHYLDNLDCNGIASSCDTESKAHAIAHIYLIEVGQWQTFVVDSEWRTWYGC